MAGELRNHRGDLGRRLALRREQLGLTREQVAERASVASQYLRYLEEHPSAPSIGSLTRVARALETSVAELSGGESPVAEPPEVPHGDPVDLDPDECYELVAAHRVGRVGVSTPQGPAILPVTYALVEGTVVFGCAPDASPSCAAEEELTPFEVDHLDEAQGVGWSVLIVGSARRAEDPDEIARLAEVAGEHHPWAPGERRLWIRLRPGRVTGRRVFLGRMKLRR